MRPIEYAITKALDALRTRSVVIEPSRWQSMDVSKRREAATYELLNYTLSCQLLGIDTIEQLQEQIKPNLPWAEDHFLERVGGVPLNPGEQWAKWPWGNSANTFRSELVPQGDGTTQPGFSHTYMERFWPKFAGMRPGSDGSESSPRPPDELEPHRGIRYGYGDLSDVVEHLRKHPDSRQAFLPIWFPEDTGKADVRVPCTLGYHFIQRNGFLHLTYYIRSCDAYRHFRDDVYLAIRLGQHLLSLLQADGSWGNVRLGMFTMHMVSFHCFVNDYRELFA